MSDNHRSTASGILMAAMVGAAGQAPGSPCCSRRARAGDARLAVPEDRGAQDQDDECLRAGQGVDSTGGEGDRERRRDGRPTMRG